MTESDAATETATTTKRKAPVINTITMTDGRVVDFAGKTRMLKETLIDEDTQSVVVRFDFRNGETRSHTLNPKLMLQYAAHGASQKIGDETAGVKEVDDMVVAVDAISERLTEGEWAKPRKAAEYTGASVLVKALIEFSGKSREEINAFLKGKSQGEKIALRGADGVREIVQRLEAEKAEGSTVDTNKLLGELG